MLAGGPLTGEALQVGMERDLSVFLSLAIVIIAGLLFAIFRRRRSFRQSRPIAAELAQFTSLSEVPGRRWTSRHHWDLVKSMMRGGNWLEVGCASGLFLERVSHAGWRVTGIEPSLSLRRYAEQKLSMGT
jgi:2-polyprenyl-3-methyl-5-hydroxy-6-metoxy-1,4-benzoquinol methylase